MTQTQPKHTECWERLSYIIDWSGLTINHFAEDIGIKRAENLYQIKKGNNKISVQLADKIVERFPEVNKIWLMHGRGNAFDKNRPNTLIITANNGTESIKIQLEITITATVIQ